MPNTFNIKNENVHNAVSRTNNNFNQFNRVRPPIIINIPDEIKHELDKKNSSHRNNPDDSSLEDSTEVPTVDGNASLNSSTINSETNVINKKRKTEDNQVHEEKKLINKKPKSEENQVHDDDTDTPTIDGNTAFGDILSTKEKELQDEYHTARYIKEYWENDTISTMSQFTNDTLEEENINEQKALLSDAYENGDKKPKAK